MLRIFNSQFSLQTISIMHGHILQTVEKFIFTRMVTDDDRKNTLQ